MPHFIRCVVAANIAAMMLSPTWQGALFYTNRPELETLQYVRRKVLRQAICT